MENVLKGLIWLAIFANVATLGGMCFAMAFRRRNGGTHEFEVLLILPIGLSVLLAILGGASGFALAAGVLSDLREASLYGGIGLVLWIYLGVAAYFSFRSRA